VATNQRETKPVIDAVNDAVAALSDLIRSVRGSRGKKTDLKSRAKAAGKQVKAAGKDVKQSARDVTDDVRRAGHSLRSRFESAWEALTGNGAVAPTAAPRRRKRARRAKARAS
jgi:hypothetical protein